MSDNLHDDMAKRISEVLRIIELAQPGMESLVAATLADALIPLIRGQAEHVLKQQWRADFGYDGYANCATRDEAKEQVDAFNEALGDDVQDGEQAIVMNRFVTDWKADDE